MICFVRWPFRPGEQTDTPLTMASAEAGAGGVVDVSAETDVADLPVVDLDAYFADPSSDVAKAECKKAAEGLHKYGMLVVRTSNATQEDNSRWGARIILDLLLMSC